MKDQKEKIYNRKAIELVRLAGEMESPKAREVVIETIPVDEDCTPTPPKSPTPRTVESEPGLSPMSDKTNDFTQENQNKKVTPKQSEHRGRCINRR